MMKKHLYLLGIFLYTVLSAANPAGAETMQKSVLCKGTVLNSETGRPIPGVALYTDNKISGITTDANGEYQLKVTEGTKVRFKKEGYIWKTVTVIHQEKQKIHLSPSQGAILSNGGEKMTEIEYDGVSIPEEEWPQINPEEIGSMNMLKSNNNTVKLVIKSK
jgi:hypothetical protein